MHEGAGKDLLSFRIDDAAIRNNHRHQMLNFAEVVEDPYCKYLGMRAGRLQVDGSDPRVGMGASKNMRFEQAGKSDVVSEPAPTFQQTRVFQTCGRECGDPGHCF